MKQHVSFQTRTKKKGGDRGKPELFTDRKVTDLQTKHEFSPKKVLLYVHPETNYSELQTLNQKNYLIIY